MILHRFPRTGALSIYACAGLLGHASAQTPTPSATPTDPSLNQVVVSVTRLNTRISETPASVDVLGRQDIAAAGAQVNVTEVLGPVPGLVANNRANYAQDVQISSRGFGARTAFGVRGMRIYVDGIPGNSPDGQGQVSHIDLGSARQVEVLRGPFSALYGSSSGGVLLVTSEEGGPRTEASTTVMAGDAGSWRVAQKLSGTVGAVNYVIDASHFATDGWRQHSAATKDQFNARLGFKLGEATKAVLVFNHVDLPNAQDPQGVARAGLATPRVVPPAVLTFDTRKSTRQSQLGLDVVHTVDAENTVKLMGYGGTRDVRQYQSIPLGAQTAATAAGGVVDFGRQSWGLDARWTWQRQLAHGPLLVHAGVALDRMDEDRRGFENFIAASTPNPDPLCARGTSTLFTCGVLGALRRDENNRLSSSSAYLQGQWWATPSTALHAGLRSNRIRLRSTDHFIATGNPDDSGTVTYSGATPVVGVLHTLSERVNVYASLGRGLDTPTLNEVAYNANPASSGLNLSLRPSHSTQLEVGSKVTLSPATSLNAAVFQANSSDEIVVLSNSGGRSRFQNAGRTTRRGAELSLRSGLAAGWTTRWAFTYLDATYQDSFTSCYRTTCAPGAADPANLPQTVAVGNRLPGTSRLNLYGDLIWRSRSGDIEAGLDLRAVSKMAVNDTNTEFAAGHGLLGARVALRQTVGGWTWREALRLSNLADRNYVGSVIVNQASAQYYEPGRTRGWLLSVTGSYPF